MLIEVYNDECTLAKNAAVKMIECVLKKPNSLFCLATGDTPKLTYQFFVQKISEFNIDVSKCFFIGLDEWIEVSSSNPGSCHHFLYKYIFTPLEISENQIHLFNPPVENSRYQCLEMNKYIKSKGGIDLMIVGIGMNGHIGFNEPGVGLSLEAHVIELDKITQITAQKYFETAVFISHGITLGMKQIMDAKEVIALAMGKHKSKIVQAMVNEEINEMLPASFLQQHKKSFLLLDKTAACLLKSNNK